MKDIPYKVVICGNITAYNKRSKELNLLVYSRLSGAVTEDSQAEKAFEKIFRDLEEIFKVSTEEYELYTEAILLCPKCKKPLKPQIEFSSGVLPIR